MHLILSRDDLKRILSDYVSVTHNFELEDIGFLDNEETLLTLKSKSVDKPKHPFTMPTPSPITQPFPFTNPNTIKWE